MSWERNKCNHVVAGGGTCAAGAVRAAADNTSRKEARDFPDLREKIQSLEGELGETWDFCPYCGVEIPWNLMSAMYHEVLVEKTR